MRYPLQKEKIVRLSEPTNDRADHNESSSSPQKTKPAKKSDSGEDSEKEQENNFIEDIKSAAEAQSLKNGFIYEPTSGLYYDTSTGYYYNAEYGLYYDGNNGKYYSYDRDTKEFTYHSTAVVAETLTAESDPPKKGKKRKVKKHEPKESKNQDDLEDGEISSDDSYVECSSDEDHIFDDISKHYPPSLRIVVQQSTLDKLKVGSLFLVTCKGGSLGREGQNDVLIPDINVSKCHLKFSYDETEACYKCQDMGSRNGTLLNGVRMSESTQASELWSIAHGSIIQISDTKLLCHIHSGSATCGHCEPGLLMQTEKSSNITEASSSESHKSQLKKLQKKYGLEKESEFGNNFGWRSIFILSFNSYNYFRVFRCQKGPRIQRSSGA